MNLYLITQSKVNGYDTYDSAVVAAPTATEAAYFGPGGNTKWNPAMARWEYLQHPTSLVASLCPGHDGSWVDDPELVEVELIGIAEDKLEAGIVLASFNAG